MRILGIKYTHDASIALIEDGVLRFSIEMEKCGKVLFHEAWEAQPPVMALLERLKKRGRVDTQGKWALWTA